MSIKKYYEYQCDRCAQVQTIDVTNKAELVPPGWLLLDILPGPGQIMLCDLCGQEIREKVERPGMPGPDLSLHPRKTEDQVPSYKGKAVPLKGKEKEGPWASSQQ
jgi:hypothetical protein